MKTLFFLLLGYVSFAQEVWVDGYYKSNGTYVDGYYRTTPDNTVNNNYSTQGNRNPHTGEWGDQPRESSHYYDVNYTGGTNPLANVLPPPVPKYNNSYSATDEAFERSLYYMNKYKAPTQTVPSEQHMSFQEKMNTLNLPPDGEYSQNVIDYQYEKSNPNPLESFEDDKVSFTSTPVSQPESQSNETGKTLGMVFGLFCVFLTFIILLFSKATKRY